METQRGWGWWGPPNERRESRSGEKENEGTPKGTVWRELADPRSGELTERIGQILRCLGLAQAPPMPEATPVPTF